LSLAAAFATYFLSWPTLFLAFFMLTEPFTLPPTKKQQAVYGGFVGLLSNTSLLQGIVAMSPELALVIGNLAVYPYRLRRKLFLKLISKREIAKDTYEFIFSKPENFKFEAGQYLEWMLPHEKPDSRGTRRYFTIASSPTESVVRLALKFVENGSSYKKTLSNLNPGDTIIASQLAGDFTLPKQPTKLGFIAGGIGVTPFSSHLSYLADINQSLDIKLFYCVNKTEDLAYFDEFKEIAEKINLEVIPVVAKEAVKYPYEHGFVTKEVLDSRCQDYAERHWYLSGPPPMVDTYTNLLAGAGVPKKHITKDFFPGLA
jgi:ferredoxin-NADP reductase